MREKDEPESIKLNEWEQLLDFYHIESVQQIVTIMQNPAKSE